MAQLAAIFSIAVLFASCGKPSSDANTIARSQVKTLGAVEVKARLVEIPEGAIFERDLYDYATILKYEVISVQRGPVEPGAIIYVGHYDPWKPRAAAADGRAKGIGGTLRQFRAGAIHHMALDVPIEDHFMGGVVNKYFGKHSGQTYWAVWTDAE